MRIEFYNMFQQLHDYHKYTFHENNAFLTNLHRK